MGTTLTGTKVKDTYKSLVKLTDNGEASATGKQLSDGNGNDLGVFVDTDGVVGIGAAAGVSLDVSSKTDAIRIPNGTTSQRVTGTAGQIRYNTTTNKIEGYVAGSTNDFIDLGQAANAGDITGVTAGDGLSGGGTSGNITVAASVDDSTIEINADALRVKDAGITAAKLAADAIGSAAIADNAIVSDAVADNAILTAAINANAVTAAKLSLFDDATAATDTHILVADGTDFVNKAVSGDATLANTGAITIASDSVTYDKMQDTTTGNRLLGAASAGTIGEVQVATDMVSDAAITNAKVNFSSGAITVGGNGSTGGVTVNDGSLQMRTGTGSVSEIRMYCESSNAHFQTVKAAPHSAASSAVLVLPTNSGNIVGTGDVNSVGFTMLSNRYTELVALGSGTAFALNFLNGTTFTATASGAATFTFSNAVQGQTIDLILSGNYAITFAESGATFNKIGTGQYDGTTNNIIQITCTDDTGGAEKYHYTVATFAADTTP